MNEEQKKRLTEFIGECWHEPLPEFDSYVTSGLRWRCPKCNYVQTLRFRGTDRTFLTPDDQQACMEALVREGFWKEFIESVFVWKGYRDFSVEEIASKVNQLFRPFVMIDGKKEAHFCALVAESLEARGGQK